LELSEAFNESQNGHHEQVKGLFTKTSNNHLEKFSIRICKMMYVGNELRRAITFYSIRSRTEP